LASGMVTAEGLLYWMFPAAPTRFGAAVFSISFRPNTKLNFLDSVEAGVGNDMQHASHKRRMVHDWDIGAARIFDFDGQTAFLSKG